MDENDSAQVDSTDRFCASCGAEFEQGAAFCGQCGSPGVASIVSSGIPLPDSNAAEQQVPSPLSARSQAHLAAPTAALDVGDLTGLALGAAIGLAVGLIAAAGVTRLAGVTGFSGYLCELSDLAFAVSSLVGLVSGSVLGARHKTLPVVPRSPWPAAIAGGAAALATLLVGPHAGSQLFSSTTPHGFYALGRAAGSSEVLGGILFVLPALASGYLGWRGARFRRWFSITILGLSIIVLSVGIPMLWRLYQLAMSVGGPK